MTTFDWGAARHLPYLPRVVAGRTILAAARWRLKASDLPPASSPPGTWESALGEWRDVYRVPSRVELVDGDQYLPVDLDQPGDREVLRAHLTASASAVLAEDPDPGGRGWCGGRAHDVIVMLTAKRPPPWPPLPAPVNAKVTARGHGDTPAGSKTMLASLDGDIHRQDLILTRYLPDLLDRLGDPAWWFIRYRDPDPHLRLRIALPEPGAFGRTASVISTWVGELQQAGLLRQVTYPTSYAETGRWGSGTAWRAAEEVFRADSRAMLAQLGQPRLPARQALAAAQAVAIAVAFTGSVPAGMRWLLGNIPAGCPAAMPRPLFEEAVRIADPTTEWAALRASPAAEILADSWASRDQALARYRFALDEGGGDGISPDDVLGSLIHVNYVRSRAIDFGGEAVVLHLARSAALSWTARNRGKSA